MNSIFAQFMRRCGVLSASDFEMFRAFDMEYEYDIREVFDRYMKGECGLSNYIDALNYQDCQFPGNHIKLRFLENHDQPRIASFVKEYDALENFTAFLYFLKGTTLIYAGQEYREEHIPSLFDKDVFGRDESRNISPLLKKLYDMKQSVLSDDDDFMGSADDEKHIAVLRRENKESLKLGVFSLKALSTEVKMDLPDGEYTNCLDGEKVLVQGGTLRCSGKPIIIKTIK